MALHFLDDLHNYCCPLVDLFENFRNTAEYNSREKDLKIIKREGHKAVPHRRSSTENAKRIREQSAQPGKEVPKANVAGRSTFCRLQA